jgi:hypothetical protein
MKTAKTLLIYRKIFHKSRKKAETFRQEIRTYSIELIVALSCGMEPKGLNGV